MEGMNEAIVPLVLAGLKSIAGPLVTAGSLIFIWWITKITGKASAQVKMGLNLQELHEGHIKKLNNLHDTQIQIFKEEIAEIRRTNAEQIKRLELALKIEIARLVEKVEELKESDRVKQQWENESIKKDVIIKNQMGIMSTQEMEIEELKKQLS